uniref:Uncharacterized protein n=1 Tax=Anopheles culicifacies TaxID=139723 RepID=A0A182MKM4_9DIPT
MNKYDLWSVPPPVLLLTPQSIIRAAFPPPSDPIGFVVPVGVEQALLEPLFVPKLIVPIVPKGAVEQMVAPGLGIPVSLVRKNFGVIRPLLELLVAARGNGPHNGILLPMPLLLLLPFSKEVVDESGLGQIGEGDGV